MTKQAKRKSLQRWKQMEALGATFLDKNGVRSPVRMKEDALTFFRDIAKSFEPNAWIPVDSGEHAWLVWLLSGHPDRDNICPHGPVAFSVYLNSDIGHLGDGRGFAVLNRGATRLMRFGFDRALLGIHGTPRGQVQSAFRHAIEDQVSAFRAARFREGVFRCPVFGTPLVSGGFHVDHDPPFVQLMDTFLAQTGLSLGDIQMTDRDVGGHQVWLPLEPVCGLWQRFHYEHARLQFVSIDGHVELTRRRKLAESDE